MDETMFAVTRGDLVACARQMPPRRPRYEAHRTRYEQRMDTQPVRSIRSIRSTVGADAGGRGWADHVWDESGHL